MALQRVMKEGMKDRDERSRFGNMRSLKVTRSWGWVGESQCTRFRPCMCACVCLGRVFGGGVRDVVAMGDGECGWICVVCANARDLFWGS